MDKRKTSNKPKIKQTGGLLSYNPNLAKDDRDFERWYTFTTPEGLAGIPFSNHMDYDYYSYYKNGEYKNYKEGDHFPDTYKKPNHKTFSRESIYSTPENPGGSWEGEKFIPMKKLKNQTGGLIMPDTEDWQRNNPQITSTNPFENGTGVDYQQLPQPSNPYKRQFDITQPNVAGLGIMGAYLGSKYLLNKSNDRNYQAYKNRWIRDYNIPSLIQDPNKFSSEMYESPIYQQGGAIYTKNPNDPRLKAYQDSLAIYRGTQDYNKIIDNSDNYKDFYHGATNSILRKNAQSIIKSRGWRDPMQGGSKIYPTGGSSAYATFPEPKQPVIFGKEPGEIDKSNKPIYVSDVKDPRLQNYNDSLNLHNLSERSKLILRDKINPLLSKGDNTRAYSLWETYQTKTQKEAERSVKKLGSIRPVSQTVSTFDESYKVNNFRKPVQPVVYEKPLDPIKNLGFIQNKVSNVQIPNQSQWNPSININSPISKQDPTNYSFTYPTGPYNEHKSIYFQSAASWRKFVKDRNMSSQEGSDYGTATGNLEDGGMTMTTPEDQGSGYFKYPNAKSLTFPGKGKRTFVPGPFPLLVKDQRGTQIMTDKPVKTVGRVTEIPIFEEGGEVRKMAPKVKRSDATIEAQKGELIFGAGAPGDVEDQKDRVGIGLYRIGGELHSNGGTPLKAFPGDFVFSNETSLAPNQEDAKLLVGKEIKKLKQRTPAKLAAKYMKLNEFLEMAQDGDLDPITKKTAALNVNNYIDRLAEIGYAQEEKKGFPEGIPDFIQMSLSTRFDQAGLQSELNQFKMGGAVKKYQQAGLVSDEAWDRARRVNKPTQGTELMGTRGWNSLYRLKGAAAVGVNRAIPGGQPGRGWEQSIIERLKNGVSPEDLVKQGYIGPEGAKKYGQYYVPKTADNYEMTSDPFKTPRLFNYPNLDNLKPNIPYNPAQFNLGTPTINTDTPFDTYTDNPNQNFDVNLAEATNLLAAWAPSESRYPPAFRNYEIQNAKALVASSGRPISEQPYLNSIARSNLGFDQNNNPYGAAGATRGLGAYQASLGAQNQAISQVYGQNIQRADQRSNQLAQLEVQDGVDRITNAERYDNKLEMLANNRELESKDRLRNTSNIFNQMTSDRENKRLFNVMSDWYQINPSGSIGMKPVYKIQDGKLVQVERNVRDMIKSQASASTQYSPALQLAQQLENMGYDREQISRILARSVDDYDKPAKR